MGHSESTQAGNPGQEDIFEAFRQSYNERYHELQDAARDGDELAMEQLVVLREIGTSRDDISALMWTIENELVESDKPVLEVARAVLDWGVESRVYLGVKADRRQRAREEAESNMQPSRTEEGKMTGNQIEGKERNGVFITIPAKIGTAQESVRRFEVRDKDSGEPRKLAEITLPYGTQVGGEDVSYYKTIISQGQLDPAGQRYPTTHSVLLPETNFKTGEDWQVKLTRDFGSRDENGTWVPDVDEKVITSREFQTAMREQYAGYKARRQEKAKEEPGAGLDDLEEMRDSASRPGPDAPMCPAQEPSLG